MTIMGAWTELVPHDRAAHAEVYRRVFDAGSQRLFAGTDVRPLSAEGVADTGPNVRVGSIFRRGRRRHDGSAGLFDCRLRAPGCFHLGVVLADSDDWGNGLGMDAMMALLRYLFHYEGYRTFEMSAGIHNGNTVRILANGMVEPEAVCAASMADGHRLRELVVGSLSAADFATAGYVPDAPHVSDELWASVRDRVTAPDRKVST